VYGGWNLVLAAAAAAICAYIAPAAAGSGIPEVKAYLNGVDAYSILAPSTLFVKVSFGLEPYVKSYVLNLFVYTICNFLISLWNRILGLVVSSTECYCSYSYHMIV
jgi:site-specific recombinase